MIRSSRSRPAPGRRFAAATVEFAVLAPLLGLIALGMVEMGRAMTGKEVLNDAARRACRRGILPGSTTSDITAEATNILNDNGIASAKVTVTVLVNGKAADAGTAQQNDQVAVKVAVPYSQFALTPTLFLTNTTVESETLVMMRQR